MCAITPLSLKLKERLLVGRLFERQGDTSRVWNLSVRLSAGSGRLVRAQQVSQRREEAETDRDPVAWKL